MWTELGFKQEMLADQRRMYILRAVRGLGIDSAMLAGDFVRFLLWEGRHELPNRLDVCFFDPAVVQKDWEYSMEKRLNEAFPLIRWNIQNEARYHEALHGIPESMKGAMMLWPETIPSVGIRLLKNDDLEWISPYPWDLIVQTPALAG